MDELNPGSLVEVGRVVGETTHYRVTYVADSPPKVGEYVLIEHPDDYLLGLVEVSVIGNPMASPNLRSLEAVRTVESLGAQRLDYVMGEARILSKLGTLMGRREVEIPRTPPQPMARVFKAGEEVLKKIFAPRSSDGSGSSYIRLGTLVNHPEIPVYVDANALISRHLAVLAVTGAGKSNTVAVLAERIVNELGGTVLILDVHSEYQGVAGENTHVVEPRIHPERLSLEEYYGLLGLDASASKQRLYLRRAYRALREEGLAAKEPEKFLDNLIARVEFFRKKFSGDSRPISDLLNKLEELKERYWGRLLTPGASMDLTKLVVPGKLNVVRLGHLDEEASDVVASHILRRLLSERKARRTRGEGYPVPVLVVIEEAHVLVPRDRRTYTKEVVARIAREGRKFGVGMCLVSQRPKNVDDNALSQTNNKIILKLVEPQDLRYVQAASENLSEELMRLLPSLNKGEAVVLGMMVPLPALVKIDLSKTKKFGADIDVVSEWRKYRESQGVEGGEDLYESLDY